MGGNALKNTYTRRYDRDEYLALEQEVIQILDINFRKAWNIPTFSGKESFGDMDLIVFSDMTSLKELVQEKFQPNEMVRNGDVLSFDYKELQIDLIVFRNMGDAQFARDYFSFGDRGNLLGRVARRLGFKLGHDGLKYVLRDPENPSYVIREIVVTKSWDTALQFLRYQNRSDYATMEDIFEWVCAGEYFDPGAYNLAFRSHDARVRDRKRPFYNQFLKYLRENHGLTDETEPVPLDKDFHLQRAFKVFPRFNDVYHSELKKHEDDKKWKQIVDHKLVTEVAGVEGRELGGALTEWRFLLENINVKTLLLSLDLETSRNIFELLLRERYEQDQKAKQAGSSRV